MATQSKVVARTYYLNEQHELSRSEKTGGGRTPQYIGIDWAAKGRQIRSALDAVKAKIAASTDPLRDGHYFVLAKPVSQVQKKSADKKKAPDGTVQEEIDFAGEDSRAFRRLGLDLVEVTPEGDAIVHMRPERLDQLATTAQMLDEVGAREQARWAGLDAFGLIPPQLRVDDDWLRSLRAHKTTDAVVEFQPLLARAEVDVLLRALASLLKPERSEAFTGGGTDFSGRHWLRGKITPESLRSIARAFYSVQTLHSPLLSLAALAKRTGQGNSSMAASAYEKQLDVSTLPTVAVLDTGVPSDHSILRKFRRGSYVSPDSYGQPVGDHGTFVASRIVFGDPDFGNAPPSSTPPAACQYYDALIATSVSDIDDKSVTTAIDTVVGTAPDVRVFNLSFDTAPLDQLDFTKRRENLILVQNLDNQIFRYDVLVVVSAGNSPPGVQPANPYPTNYDDPQWQLGAWARSFNALTCGSLVERLSPGGLGNVGWPSPFTRVGPGLCESVKPDFAANGGNTNSVLNRAPGMGVWGLTSAGRWEDKIGTSFAAPLLAREAAFAVEALQKVCQQGAKPYAVTVKAFLALAAVRPTLTGLVSTLAERALGRGTTSSTRIEKASSRSAVLIWQGMLGGPGEIARVKMPIPKEWYEKAKKPRLRLVVCWDPPVNFAASDLWATRKVTAHFKPSPDSTSLYGTRGSHRSYPAIDRSYDLRKLPKGATLNGDTWLLELNYDQVADYYPGMEFSLQQRVAFAAEIYDDAEEPLSPHGFLQALPSAVTMTRLSIPPQGVKTPVVIRSLG
jgi:hypothetical protein